MGGGNLGKDTDVSDGFLKFRIRQVVQLASGHALAHGVGNGKLPGDGVGGVYSVPGNHNHLHTSFLTAFHSFGNTRTDGVLHTGKTDKNEFFFCGFPVTRPHGKSQDTQSTGRHFLYGITDFLLVGGCKRHRFAV